MIKVENLVYTYNRTDSPAVNGLSFEIAPGEIFGFLGPSGAGKSTTQKILIGLLKGYEGHVSVMGKERSQWDAEFYEQVGVSFELPNHYLKLTGLENLEYFRSLYDGETEDPDKLLDVVGLTDAADKRVEDYSKGMQMRLNFVRALLNKPKLLFLDEPTSGLDPVNARVIMNIIEAQRKQGTTVFLTTHNMQTADVLCDRVAFIVDGEISLIDTPKALKIAHGERRVVVEVGSNTRLEVHEFALDGLGQNAEFIDLIRWERIETIHTMETTLENIFIKVTGRQLT